MKKRFYVYTFLFFLLDQISKLFILNLDKEFPIKVINNFFYIDKAKNTRAAFSILGGYSLVFIIIGIVAIFYINKYFIKDINKTIGFLGISLLVGGILGNLCDRIARGYVIDFLSFKFGNYYFPTFNLADTFICIGVLFVIIDFIRGDKNGN